MATNDVFLKIIDTMPEGLERQVLKVLSSRPKGDRVTREDFVYILFGVFIDRKGLQNSKEDRQIRRAITTLQNMGVPVFSDSASGGYWLGTERDCAEYLKELMNRRKALDEKIDAIWKTQRTFYTQDSLKQGSLL